MTILLQSFLLFF